MAVLCTKEDPIIRVLRNLLEQNCSGLCILHESRLEVDLIIEFRGVSADAFDESKPTFERSRIIFQRLPLVFGTFYEVRVMEGSRGFLKLDGKGLYPVKDKG